MKRIIIICPYCGNTQNGNKRPYCEFCTQEFNVEIKTTKMEVQE